MSVEHEHKVSLGLGEAILRLLDVEALLRNKIGTREQLTGLREEKKLLREALDSHQLELGLACSLDHGDTVPEGPERFNTMATTSCCRISLDAVREGKSSSSETTSTESAPKKRTVKSGSRL